MSARLMCKANGGILIDDATFVRLPSTVLTLLTALDPIKVKGRDEPLQVYSYHAAESIDLHEKVVETHAIPLEKRQLMLNFLGNMQNKEYSEELEQILSPPSVDNNNNYMQLNRRLTCLQWLREHYNILYNRQNNRQNNLNLNSIYPTIPLQLLLIKGRNGSGRTSVVKWLKKQAIEMNILVYCIKISTKDTINSYYIWKKLFYLLVPKEYFVSIDIQRSYIHNLLNLIYPNANRTIRKEIEISKINE